MITISGLTGKHSKNNKIQFSPRAAYRGKGIPTLEFPLVYGHTCPYCSNVIQALFKVPSEFSLWQYEETSILSQGEKNSGELRKVFPDEGTKPEKSHYNMSFSPAEGGNIKLVLKNHIVRHRAIAERKYNGEGLWEPGGHACIRAGIFSIREDLLAKDWLMFSKIDSGGGVEISKYKLPPIEELLATNQDFRIVRAIGVAPPVILIEKQPLVYGFHYQLNNIIQPYHIK